jgi:hypothetical protein
VGCSARSEQEISRLLLAVPAGKYPDIPNIDTWKWLDTRRMTNVCERWAQDHTNALQGAWFNGVGFGASSLFVA